jgi:hypothetical protein
MRGIVGGAEEERKESTKMVSTTAMRLPLVCTARSRAVAAWNNPGGHLVSTLQSKLETLLLNRANSLLEARITRQQWQAKTYAKQRLNDQHVAVENRHVKGSEAVIVLL